MAGSGTSPSRCVARCMPSGAASGAGAGAARASAAPARAAAAPALPRSRFSPLPSVSLLIQFPPLGISYLSSTGL